MTVHLLRASYDELKKQAVPGVDGVTWQQYGLGLEERWVDLHARVHRGAYRAEPSKRAYSRKEDGRQRPLGIARLETRSSNRPWSLSSRVSMKRTLRGSRKVFGPRAAATMPWTRWGWADSEEGERGAGL